MTKSQEIKLRTTFLKLQYQNLLRRWEKQKKKDAFIKQNLERILCLKMDGWPRTKNMKDYRKWLDIIYEAKLKGIYALGTSNCDVIANLSRFAKEMKKDD